MTLHPGDTLIKINLKGTINDFVFQKSSLRYIDIRDFQNTINQFKNKLEFKSHKIIEITGEGHSNDVYIWINESKDGFLVINSIQQNDTTIWNDSLLVNDDIWYYWEDSVFFRLKPYSQFYIAHKYFRDFVGEPFDTTFDFKQYTKLFYYINYTQDSTYWNNYLGNFKGRLIKNLSPESADTYIWDRRQRKFIVIHEP
jgi:hypothetical protein